MNRLSEVRSCIAVGDWRGARFEAVGCPIAQAYCDAHGIPEFSYYGSGSGSGDGYGSGDGDGYGDG